MRRSTGGRWKGIVNVEVRLPSLVLQVRNGSGGKRREVDVGVRADIHDSGVEGYGAPIL